MTRILLIIMMFFTPIAHANVQDDAQRQYEKLRGQKMITSNIIFAENQDQEYEHTPGYAVFDFTKQICTIFLNEKAIKKFNFDDPFSFRFMIYHEISHCELYNRPHEIVLAKVKPKWQKMASDIIHLEFFHSSMGRVNAYNTYHEIFADIMAIAMMKKIDNENAEALEKIMTYRAGNAMSFMDNHDSANAIKKYLNTLDLESPYDSAKFFATAALEEAFFKKVFKNDLQKINMQDILDGTIRTAKSQDTEWSGQDEKKFIKARVDMMKDSQHSPWKEYAIAHATHKNAEQIILMFYETRGYKK